MYVDFVTSANHMPRAVACFESLGLEVVPSPTAYLVPRGTRSFLYWMPTADALHRSLVAIHEYAGLVTYRLAYGTRLRTRASATSAGSTAKPN